MNDKIKNVSYVAVALSAVVASSVYVYSNLNTGNKSEDKVEVTCNVPASAVVATPKFTYKDGSYTASGDYTTVSGAKKMNVTLVLDDDVVTYASTVLPEETSASAKTSHEKFEAALKTDVVGKKLDDVALIAKISGSSDTTKGFQVGVASIRNLAK